DHDSIREMARQSLVNFGYRVLAANDGEQAVRLCEEEKPSLAILDVVMPHLGGPATAAQLLARFPGLPILFTSGYSEYPRLTVSAEALQPDLLGQSHSRDAWQSAFASDLSALRAECAHRNAILKFSRGGEEVGRCPAMRK